MPQESKEKLRRFEQKLREEGSDGFADGPRPWEHWDESGHQANNRIWEGSAKRIYQRRKKTRSLGYRLLSVLAFLALTTLLVGIGGVYYSHTQSQQLAQREVQPLPATPPPLPSTTSADKETVITAAASQPHDLNVLSAPAAGSGATQDQALAAIETAPAVDAAIPVTDEPVLATGTIETAAMTPETIPPATTDSIDSVSIETIVTEKSVTTTVYTRHPQQQEAEIVAAIETTPPPFARGVVDAPQQMPEAEPPAVHITDDEAMTAAPSTMPPQVLEAVTPGDAVTETADEFVTATADDDQLDVPADDPATEAAEQESAATFAEPGNETVTVALVETTAGVTAEPIESTPGMAPTDQTEDAAAVAVTERSDAIAVPEPLVETAPEVTTGQRNALPDNQATEQAEDAIVVAITEADSATAVPEVRAEPSNDGVAAVTPVAKTGGWVINLASYTWKSTASRKLALFQQQGVDGEIFAVTINDKPMYRIRVTGFKNSREAKARIPAIEEALDLEGAWISRR